MNQKKKSGLRRGLADIVQKQTAPIDKSAESSSLIARFREPASPSKPDPGAAIAPGEIISPSAVVSLSEHVAPGEIVPTQEVQASPGADIAPSALLARITQPTQHTRVPNDLLDSVLKDLLPSDQLILLRLYRLTRGHHSDSITVAYETLGKACHLSRRAAIDSVQRLEREGLVKRTGKALDTAQNLNRGVTIRMLIPSAISAENAPGANISPGAAAAPNKLKALKDNSKVEAAPITCPDCHGTGWTNEVREGRSGVVKCSHVQLSKT
jgi:hypothetical protein